MNCCIFLGNEKCITNENTILKFIFHKDSTYLTSKTDKTLTSICEICGLQSTVLINYGDYCKFTFLFSHKYVPETKDQKALHSVYLAQSAEKTDA